MQNFLNKTLKDNYFLVAALLLTILVYSRFLFFGHISWDDPEMVFRNNAVHDFNLKELFTNHYVGNYIPFTMVVHSIVWQIFGSNDWAHHLVNILLHLLNGYLVYRVLEKLFPEKSIAIICSIIFLLHPMQVESVGWISELKNVLSTTFYLAGLFYYTGFKQGGKIKDLLFTYFFFIAGCLSKSSVVVFPLSLFCIDILKTQRITLKEIKQKIPMLLLSIGFGIINIKTQTADLFINHSHEFPFYEKLGYAGFAILKYLQLFLFPFNLSVIYPYPVHKSAIVIGVAVVLLLITLIFILFRKRSFKWLVIILFILVNLALVLQFLPFGEVLYADRYQYVPIIGFALLIALLLEKIRINKHIIYIFISLYFTVITLPRINAWRSSIVLYEDIIKKYPQQFIALNSAGVERMFMNNDEQALEYFNKAVVAAPRNYKGYYNRGLLFLKNKKPKQAIQSFNESLKLYDYPKAYTGRAAAYYMVGDIPKAMNDAQLALSKDKNNIRAHFVLANCYNDLNKINEALEEYNYCIRNSPEEPDFYFKRAIALGKKQDYNQCLNDLNNCLIFKPDYYEAYYWRAVAKVNLKLDPCSDFYVSAQQNFEPAIKAFQKYCR